MLIFRFSCGKACCRIACMKNIAIYGAGGFGREVACLLRKINEVSPTWNFVGFFDDGVPAGTQTSRGEILGGTETLNAVSEPLALAFAIADPQVLKKLVAGIRNPRIEFPNLIAPDVHFHDRASVKWGCGNIINTRSAISCDCVFGNFNLSVFDNIFGHDSRIGDFNIFFTGTRISGNVTIGQGNVFGAGTTILQNLKIGNGNTIAAASLLVTPVANNASYIGVPATKFNFKK